MYVILIPTEMVDEAKKYASGLTLGHNNTHRTDFFENSSQQERLKNKRTKMYEGKLAEKAIRILLLENSKKFKEDTTPVNQSDKYDFLVKVNNIVKTVDVKTRTKDFHTKTMMPKDQIEKKPKDIYIATHLDTEKKEVKIIGYITHQEITKIGRYIKENLYTDTCVILDNELHDIDELLNQLDNNSYEKN